MKIGHPQAFSISKNNELLYHDKSVLKMKFGRLRILGEDLENVLKFICICDCGNVVSVLWAALRNKNTKSCRCLAKELTSKRFTTHGYSNSLDYDKRSLFNCWVNMLDRCYNKNHLEYHNYGGKGIKVCKRWKGKNGFLNFLKDMGIKPNRKYSLDRIYSNRDYKPSNCRWATWKTQERNRTNSTRTKNYPLHKYWRGRLISIVARCLTGELQSTSVVLEKYVGCSPQFLRDYIASKFLSDMSWKNRGILCSSKKTWEIDHIKQCNQFDLSKVNDRKECFNYKNLRPWWANKNRERGGKKF